MLDTFEKLSKRARGWESRLGVEWAFVSIELGDVPDGPPRYTGIVLIDGRQVGYLVGNSPREFRLAPGEHRIAVHLGRETRVFGYPGRRPVSGLISLEAGERVALVCGTDGPVADRWVQFGDAARRYGRATLGICLLAACLGWIIGPSLQLSIVNTLNGLGIGGEIASMYNSPERFRKVMPWFSYLVAFLLLATRQEIWEWRTLRRLQSEIGSPYRLGRRSQPGWLEVRRGVAWGGG